MSEWDPQVVKLGEIEKHPNADNLSITTVLGNYPVIFGTGDFLEGDLAGYIPVDTVMPVGVQPYLDFLWKDGKLSPIRIKARKIRGILSMGMLVPLQKKQNLQEGDSIINTFKLEKYEASIEKQFLMSGKFMPSPSIFVPTYDIKGLRRYIGLIEEGEQVVITEKIHGTNARFVYWDDTFYCASRNNWVNPDGDSVWAQISKTYELKTLLKDFPGLVLYGEIYGVVQKLHYGLNKGIDIMFYDCYYAPHKIWRSPLYTELKCSELALPHVPILYRGSFDTDIAYTLSEGPSMVLTADHPREGIVISPAFPRTAYEIGNVKLKLIGETFLLNKRS